MTAYKQITNLFYKVPPFKFESPPQQSFMLSSQNSQYPFLVTTTFWKKDHHGFLPRYSYQRNDISQEVQRQSVMVKGPLKVFRDNIHNENVYSSLPMVFPQQYDYVCDIEVLEEKQPQRQSQCMLKLSWKPPFGSNCKKLFKCPRQPYLSIKDLSSDNNQGYKLELGDVIKLGIVRLIVTEIKKEAKDQQVQYLDRCSEEQIYENDPVRDLQGNFTRYNNSPLDFEKQYGMENEQTQAFDKVKSQKNNKEVIEEQNNQCRICFLNQQDEPLISPCNCKGTHSKIHFSCLKTWMKTHTKIKKKSNEDHSCLRYKLIQSQCEICKKLLPNMLKQSGKFNSLIPFPRPNGPYIVLQRFGANQEKSHNVYIIRGTRNSVSIGRHRSNSITFNNLSVSRNHASISYSCDDFFIKDEGSKLGTLIKLTKQTQVKSNNIDVQMGSCLFTFQHSSEHHQNQRKNS